MLLVNILVGKNALSREERIDENMPIHKTNLNKFNKLIDENKKRIDLVPGVKGDSDSRYTRAVSVSILEEYFKVNFQEAFDAVCEGSGDCKIDALYYSDDVDSLSDLVLIQSKYRNGPGKPTTFTEDGIKALVSNAVAVINGKALEKPNEKIKEKIEKYRALLKDNGNPSIRIVIFLATNGVICEEHKQLECISEARKKNIEFIFVDANAFGNEPQETSGVLKVNIKNEDDKTDSVFKKTGASMKGLLASCSLKDYLAFYHQAGKKQLLSQNVRFLLKKSKVNARIIECFKTHPEDFCFLNNGISLVCESYKPEPTGDRHYNLTLNNASIVNGGQTTGVLAELIEAEPGSYEDQLSKASVVLRVFEATPEQAFKIAEATNSQNPIDIVNLKANHGVQSKVKAHFAQRGVGLLVKDGEEIVFYNDTITNENLLQLYAALYKDNPAKAKVSKLAVFKLYFDEVFSEEAFRNGISEKLYRCYELSKYLYSKKLTEDNQFIANAWYALIYAIKKHSQHVLNVSIPEDQLPAAIDGAYNKAKATLIIIIEKKKDELGVRFSLNNLFKNQEIKDLIDITP